MQFRISLPSLFFLMLFAPYLPAQQGFKVGIDFPLFSLPGGKVPLSNNLGFGARFPYGIDDRVMVGVNILGAGHTVQEGSLVLRKTNSSDSISSSSWTLGWFMVDAKYYFGDLSSFRPFVTGGAGFGFLMVNLDNYIQGFGLGGGVGIENFLSNEWSLNASAILRYAWFSDAVIGGENVRLSNPFSESAVTLNIGITYHFED